MRGSDEKSGELLSDVNLEDRARRDHPLRTIHEIADRPLGNEFVQLCPSHAGGRTCVGNKTCRAFGKRKPRVSILTDLLSSDFMTFHGITRKRLEAALRQSPIPGRGPQTS